LITISRNLARQLRTVFRRALRITPRGRSYPATFQTGQDGLRVRVCSPEAAVEYYAPGAFSEEQFAIPIEVLADCEGRQESPIELEPADGQVLVRWQDGGVPQLVQVEAATAVDAEQFPRMPAVLAENPPRLWKALLEASETTDPGSLRYALACVELQGARGRIVATDGRQLLVEDGFAFPWDEDVLLYGSKLFGCPEVVGDQPVRVGRTGDHVALQLGSWRFWLPTNQEGRFPDVSRHLPHTEEATARVQLARSDAAFLAQALPRLPGGDELNEPVTVELDGAVTVRAKAAGQPKAMELVLTNSRWSGQSVRLHTNRRFLARAARLGFRELLVYGPRRPISCQDESRRFVWALLDPESAIAPQADAIRLTSPRQPNPPKASRRTPGSVRLPRTARDSRGRPHGSSPAAIAPGGGRRDVARIPQATGS
jgi:hypothetical protein